MERSWDYLLKSPIGIYLAFVCSFLVLIAIIAGGVFMRLEMSRQRSRREAQKDAEEDSQSEN